MPERRYAVVDGFYANPEAVRARALGRRFREPREFVGLRTRPFVLPGTRASFERLFGVRIRDWQIGGAYSQSNGVFFLALARGSHREVPHVHTDGPRDSLTVLVYLTPKAPVDAGLSLWKHRETGLEAEPTEADARRLGVPFARLDSLLERDSLRRERWIEIDRIGNRFNRAVAFCSNFFHSATRHFGSSPENGRLYQCFNFEVRGAAAPRTRRSRSTGRSGSETSAAATQAERPIAAPLASH